MTIGWKTRYAPFVIIGAMLLTLGACTRSRDAANVDEGWRIHLERVEHALATGHLAEAGREWSAAYSAAFQSDGWKPIVELGDAYLRFGQTPAERKLAELQAGDLYLSALMRAHRQGSVDGVLAGASAFARLGDRRRVEQALELAEQLAAQKPDGGAMHQVRAFREELAARLGGPDGPAVGRLVPLVPDAVNGL